MSRQRSRHRYSVASYDAAGRPAYSGYPVSTAPTANAGNWILPGMRTTYDALGRPISVTQDSELGTLTTSTSYLAGFKTQVTNPRAKVTTTSFLAWDTPVADYPSSLVLPEGAYLDIARDAFGKPTAITRRNSASTIAETRTYAYDAYQQLCRAQEPETGATLMGYDGAGNLAWSASGLPAGTNCDLEGDTSAILARKAARTYDARNRISTLAFPDSNGNQSWTYTPDGRPASITNWNDGGTNSVVTSYIYNKRRLLTAETSAQPGWYTWPAAYGYDANGHLASQSYPDGYVISYVPNALGQPTQAGSYATGATYWPNGALRQFTYGNGIVHSLTQNARGLPDRSRDADGATSIHDDSYDYDANGNVLAISDGVAGARGNRDMTYDALDRLTATTSPMYGATGAHYSYDVLDNLTHVVAPGRDHWYCYDINWRLTNVRTGSCGGATVIGLAYDVQGNLASKGGVPHTFDYGNRLRGVGNLEGYRYDAHGRRVLAWSPTLGNIVSMYGQGGPLLFQSNERKGVFLTYIYLGGSLVATLERNAATGIYTTTYQHTDALGSPVATTNSAKTVLQRSEYEPYGYLLNRPMEDGPGYTGHVTDAATGLVYMQQRYYDPMIPRFLSVDPVTAYSNPVGASNRYWYAAHNPYRFTDPDGRQVRSTDNYCANKAYQCGDSGGVAGATSFAASTGSAAGHSMAVPRPGAGGLPLPIPSPNVGQALAAGVQAISDAIDQREQQRIYVTYILTKPGYPRDIKYYGRASGFGTPREVMMSRFATHERRLLGYSNPVLDESAVGPDGRLAIRGREQQLIDAGGGIGSDMVGNFIRAVSPINPMGSVYHNASNAEFGPIAPYTGW